MQDELETEKVCEFCGGTGTVDRMVYTNSEPDGFDEEKCICVLETEIDHEESFAYDEMRDNQLI